MAKVQTCVVVVVLVAQSCLTFCNPVDCSPPGSSVHGILQAIILKWVALSFSRGSSQPRDQIQVSDTACRFFTIWACVRVYTLKAMATHSSTLALQITWVEEPGRLQSMGSWRVRHDWVTSLSLFTFMHWRRKWQPTPVFLPGESQWIWGCTESDTTETT